MYLKNKIYIYIIFALLSSTVLYFSFLCFEKMNTPKVESDIMGKQKSNEEYIYKEDLLNLNYTIDEINLIEQKISNVDVKNYLLTEKYDNLIQFLDSPYFNITNIKRYQNY